MFDQNKMKTKDKILEAAARMFAERGYDKVTTREIAKSVGINSASIYYYFPSKEDILTSLYAFYSKHLSKKCPELDDLLALAETDPPHEVLMKAEFHYDDEVRETLDHILVTAARRVGGDPESEYFIRKNIFDPTMTIVKPLLERLIALKKIKPFNVDACVNVLTYYCFSAAALHHSPFGQDLSKYLSGMSYIYSSIEVIEE